MFVFAAVDACSYGDLQGLVAEEATIPGVEETGGDDPPAPAGKTACYPGPDRDYDVCADTKKPANPSDDYDYPEPRNENYVAPTRYLDLDEVDPDLQVAKRFVLGELAQREKGRWAVVQVHAVERLQDVRADVGKLVVTSGYRSPGYNAGVGGATWSRHMYGDGFDLVPEDVRLTALGDACEDHGAGFVDVYENHVHCDWRDDALDPVFFPDAARRSAGVGPVPLPPREAALERSGGIWTAPATGWDEGEPLREWTAYAADGRVIDTATGRSYAPPAGAAEVEVWVGRQLRVRQPVE